MAFDRATRTIFARAIARARERLKTDVMDQLRRLGFQEDGTLLPLDQIAGLREEERQAGEDLRALLAHLAASERGGSETARRRAAYDRLAREIGFTTLHRLVAIRMAEERGIVVPATAQGFASAGFQVYERVANDALGGRAETYRAFIERLYDELALDLPALFDRADPTAWVFPSEGCLTELFFLLNGPEIAPLWLEDEAIGWVYQYYNDPDERKKMREGGAPRNTRELAVRNQFFTPRYVVEFLTDNTLGRLWYEMRRGETRLVDQCRYLIRRKHPIWLPKGESPRSPYDPERDGSDWGHTDHEALWLRPNPDPESGVHYAHTIDGYRAANRLFPELARDDQPIAAAAAVHRRVFDRHRETGAYSGSFEELRIAQFFAYRADRHGGGYGDDEFFAELHQALCAQWDLEADVIPHRPVQDPRDLKLLDPACGSGHFLLYAFDLLTTIYEEAYDDPEIGGSLRMLYPERARFERDLPRLILEHNLHGVDIDPRAAQIAQLALWLRAQRAWTEAGLAAANRPRVQKIRIVTAEPMPAEPDLIEAAKARLDPRLRPLVDQIWEKMRLAGEAGTLLRIEEEIREALAAAARRAGADLSVPVRRSLPGLAVAPEQTSFDLTPGSRSDAAFWANEAEPALLAALEQIAEEAEGRAAVRRRLFVRDAATGFAFIDLCRLQFDVVLMNPPFGEGASGAKAYIESAYPRTKNDLFAAFVERGLNQMGPGGRLGAITSRTGFFLTSFKKWREEILLDEAQLVALADLGQGVLDNAMVETAAYVVEK